MVEEVKEATKTVKETGLFGWLALIVAALVVLGSAGYYYYANENQIALELTEKAREEVVVQKDDNEVKLTATTDSDLRDIDNTMNGASSEDFADNTLDDKAIGL